MVSRRHILPLSLIALGSLILVGLVVFVFIHRGYEQPGAAPLPAQIGGLAQTSRQTGSQAVAEFTRLHGESFPIMTGAKGEYGNNQVTLWVAGTADAQAAAQLVTMMRDKIAQGNSPFLPTAEMQLGKRTLYALSGLGQNHFYFQSSNLVIWLATDPDLQDKVLSSILNFYP